MANQTQVQHTPGPWESHAERTGEVLVWGPGYALAESLAQYAGEDNREANARLIASAPELLAALELAYYQYAHRMTTDDADVMEAAIAKATSADA